MLEIRQETKKDYEEVYKDMYMDQTKYFEGKHSGHGMQNDDKVFEQYMKTVDEYLEKYMPVQK